MKIIGILLLLFGLVSCSQGTGKTLKNNSDNIQDTIIKKHRNDINKSYEVGLYSKSYTYYWLVGIDTLDLRIHAKEYLRDSTLHINVHHNNPVHFDTILIKIIESLAIIEDDFTTSKLYSLYFKPPIYYKDIVNELSGEYKEIFGEKNVDHHILDEFLLQSNLNIKLNDFLDRMNKRVHSYSIEKFHLLSHENYDSYFFDENLTTYPEFSIHGMGIYVQIKDMEK